MLVDRKLVSIGEKMTEGELIELTCKPFLLPSVITWIEPQAEGRQCQGSKKPHLAK